VQIRQKLVKINAENCQIEQTKVMYAKQYFQIVACRVRIVCTYIGWSS